ncbi:MAG: methylhydantoinase [Rhodospirillaceae bacterium]|nr:methylhydantoinase [Rhodospirillaceae bacterium]
MWFIGVDVGGTFTDFHALNTKDGRVAVHKTPSTAEDPSRAILDGLSALMETAGIVADEIQRLAHGTTVATNTLIQRKGAEVAVITTEGFRDLLEIGRQIRPKMYDLKADYPPPLAPRHMRFEVNERIGGKGQVIRVLSDEAIATVVEEVAGTKTEACAVCLLFSFLEPHHEHRIGAALRERLPERSVSLSCEVQPEFREYERFSTTLLNAYLQPIIGQYMKTLGSRFAVVAPKARLGINQSSGGLMSVERAGDMPIRTALSGPAAGTVGAIYQARLAERPQVITLDMGGTSADVALIQGHEASIGYDRTVAGFPMRLPMIDIHTVGAGGGSIAWFDRDGLMKVGPLSAGADPGPACYGRGGTEPTVSDANLVLGRLPDTLIGGVMGLDVELARRAIQPAADLLGLTVEHTAHGMLGIVVANMVRAVRTISVERGHDPRDFSLMAFGGAGALHAGDVARALEMRELIVPPAPGILCAQGLVVSDLKEDFVTTRRLPYNDKALDAVTGELQVLCDRAETWFEAEGIVAVDRITRIAFDMRYVRQNFELTVPWVEIGAVGEPPDMSSLESLRQRFYALHKRTYGHFTETDPIEIVNIRVTAVGRAAPEQPVPQGDSKSTPTSPIGTRAVWFEADVPVDTPVYARAELNNGQVLRGPAVIEQLDALTLIHPGDIAKVDGYANLIIEVGVPV